MRGIAALAAVLAALLGADAALGCSCAAGQPGSQRLERVEGAVVGTVTERHAVPGTRDVRLQIAVERVFKGQIGEQVEVTTSSEGGTCGLGSGPGDRISTLLTLFEGRWYAGTCHAIGEEELRIAASRARAVAATGASLTAVDRDGATIVDVSVERPATHVAACPGGRRVVVVRGGRLEVRVVPELSVAREVALRDAGYVIDVACLDELGEQVAMVRETSPLAVRAGTVGADGVVSRAGRGTSGVLAGGRAVLGSRDRADVVDPASGRVRTLRVSAGELLAGSADGSRVAAARGILDLRGGRLHRRALRRPVTFLTATRLLVADTGHVLDERARVLRRIGRSSPTATDGPLIAEGARLRLASTVRMAGFGRLPAAARAVALCG